VAYSIKLPLFEGPLDLLLQLIEREELDITKVALAQVTDQYLQYIESLVERDIDEMAGFIVVASRLLQIKSEALLPKPVIREPGEEDPGEALAQQLIVYRRFKAIAEFLAGREEGGFRTYVRINTALAREATLDLEGVTVADLFEAYKTAVSKRRPRLDVGVAPERVRLRDKIASILNALRRRKPTSFGAIVKSAKSRLEIVVSFLAVLELVKLRKVRADQEELFGDIALERGDSWEDAQDEEFELEFEE
jgi:segregation and condensation protein A